MIKFITLILLFLSLSVWAQKDPSKTALMIIDMQDYFISRSGTFQMPDNEEKIKLLHENLTRLISAAKANNRPIIIVEYADTGETSARIKNQLKDYKKAHYVIKNEDGVFEDKKAGEEVDKIMTQYQANRFIVTGANGGACVERTIEGIIEKNYVTRAVTTAIADFNWRQYVYPYTMYEGYEEKDCPKCNFKMVNTDEAVDEMNSSTTANNAIFDGNRSPKIIPTGGTKKNHAPGSAIINR